MGFLGFIKRGKEKGTDNLVSNLVYGTEPSTNKPYPVPLLIIKRKLIEYFAATNISISTHSHNNTIRHILSRLRTNVVNEVQTDHKGSALKETNSWST